MQQQEGLKRFLPHLLVIAIFIALSCAFCYPAFQGKTLDQHDMKTWLWASKESRDYHEKTGESALWANNMFGGMPQVQVDAYPENNWYNKLNHIIQLYTHGEAPNPATFFFIAMGCFYILMCTLRVNKWLGAIGAVAFAFSAYNPTIITAGHTTKMLDIAFIPAIMAGIIIAYRGKYLAGGALAGLFLAFSFDSGHLQIIYYSMFLVVAMVLAALVHAIRKNAFKQWMFASITLLLAAGFAFLTSASRLMQTEEYAPYSNRGGGSELTIGKKSGDKSSGLDKEYAFSWSNGVGETFSILVPNLYGGSIKENIGENSHYGEKLSELGASPDAIEQMTSRAPLYWGPQPLLSGSPYFGAVICFLSVLSLFVIRSRYKWWLAGVAVFILCIAMGKNFSTFNYFMFDHFPGFNKFRSPNMAPAVASVIFPMLAMWALKDIFEEKITKAELFKKLKLSLFITGGLCVAILLATFSFDYIGANDKGMEQQYGQAGPALIKALREDRSSAATGDAVRSLIFVLLAGGVLYAFSKDKLNKTTAIAAIGLLVVVDMIPVAHRWLNSNDFVDTEEYMAQNFQPSPADAQILQDKDPYYRVLDATSDPFSDSKPSYFHKSVGGYHGAKLQSYVDIIEHQISKNNMAVLNMLNTKYIIVPGGQGQAPAVQRNPEALGNAWFVDEIKWVKTADEEMLALNTSNNPADSLARAANFNPARTAVLRDTFKAVLGNYAFGRDSAAGIQLAPNGYGPRTLKFESNNSKDGLAVFSDIYYPIGWKATIDGKETPIMRTDYILRALKVPAGKHAIVFTFDSAAYEKGKSLALIGSILLTLLIAGGLFVTFRPAKNEPAKAM